jgi:hypothetical protein
MVVVVFQIERYLTGGKEPVHMFKTSPWEPICELMALYLFSETHETARAVGRARIDHPACLPTSLSELHPNWCCDG